MDVVRRVFGMWLGLWFVFLVAEPVPVHDCPMHSPHPQAAMGGAVSGGVHEVAPHSEEHHGSHGEETHQSHGKTTELSGSNVHSGSPTQHSGSQHADSSHHSTQNASHSCLCLGCAAGSAPVQGSQPSSLVPVPEQIARVKATYPTVEHSPIDPAFTLPPSTAPPQLS